MSGLVFRLPEWHVGDDVVQVAGPGVSVAAGEDTDLVAQDHLLFDRLRRVVLIHRRITGLVAVWATVWAAVVDDWADGDFPGPDPFS